MRTFVNEHRNHETGEAYYKSSSKKLSNEEKKKIAPIIFESNLDKKSLVQVIEAEIGKTLTVQDISNLTKTLMKSEVGRDYLSKQLVTEVLPTLQGRFKDDCTVHAVEKDECDDLTSVHWTFNCVKPRSAHRRKFILFTFSTFVFFSFFKLDSIFRLNSAHLIIEKNVNHFIN